MKLKEFFLKYEFVRTYIVGLSECRITLSEFLNFHLIISPMSYLEKLKHSLGDLPINEEMA